MVLVFLPLQRYSNIVETQLGMLVDRLLVSHKDVS